MKNRKLFFIIVLTFSIFCFVGCGDGNLSAYAYISDLISAVDSEENEMYYVQATVSIKDFTNESAIEFLSQNINSFSNARQERITDYSTAFVFDIKIPVLNKENLYKLNSYISKNFLWFFVVSNLRYRSSFSFDKLTRNSIIKNYEQNTNADNEKFSLR